MIRGAGGERAAALALALAVGLGGCGYSVHGHLPPHIRTIAVPVFTNRTQEPAVESVMTRAVLQAFSTSGRLAVVRPEEADAILDGEVVGYVVDAIAFDRDENIRQFRLNVSLNLRLRDMRRNAVVFQQSGFREKADFRVRGAVSQTISSEEGALREAAIEIARAVVSLVIDRF